MSDFCIVFASDENYGMPLATAIRSLIETNRKLAQTDIYIFSNGISSPTRRRITDSLTEFEVRLHWPLIDLSTYSRFDTLHYASRMTFARIKIPELLPAHIKRALYLDADVLVLQEITDLLLADLQGAALGAVLDGMEWHRTSGMQRLQGVPAVDRYFNAGMLLIDLERWKQTCVSERAYRFLEENPATPYADQDALNVACDGSWTMLDERWNFQRSRDVSVGRTEPAILHFVTSDKPWHPNTRNQNAALYDQFRSRTRFTRTRTQRKYDELRRVLSLVKHFIKTHVGVRTRLVRPVK